MWQRIWLFCVINHEIDGLCFCKASPEVPDHRILSIGHQRRIHWFHHNKSFMWDVMGSVASVRSVSIKHRGDVHALKLWSYLKLQWCNRWVSHASSSSLEPACLLPVMHKGSLDEAFFPNCGGQTAENCRLNPSTGNKNVNILTQRSHEKLNRTDDWRKVHDQEIHLEMFLGPWHTVCWGHCWICWLGTFPLKICISKHKSVLPDRL